MSHNYIYSHLKLHMQLLDTTIAIKKLFFVLFYTQVKQIGYFSGCLSAFNSCTAYHIYVCVCVLVVSPLVSKVIYISI